MRGFVRASCLLAFFYISQFVTIIVVKHVNMKIAKIIVLTTALTLIAMLPNILIGIFEDFYIHLFAFAIIFTIILIVVGFTIGRVKS
jgi:hypothetical membrane protein